MEYSENMLRQYIGRIQSPDAQAIARSRERWDHIAKPLRGLGRFEDIVSQIAGIQGREEVDISKKAVVVMCGDHGVAREGVTQTDSRVTAVVTENFAKGIASINRMAAVVKADVIPVDVGVDADLAQPGIWDRKVSYGTKNMAVEPAMTRSQAIKAVCHGIGVAGICGDRGYHILAAGEMGIGNTTASSAVASVLLGLSVQAVTGPGAGLSRAGVAHKIEVIEKAIRRHRPDRDDPLDVLSKLGGYDIAGMAGLYLGGAIFRIPVVIDGAVSGLAALVASRLCRETVSYMIPSHLGKEPSCRGILEELGLRPVICGDLALGEGTGAVMLFPLLDMACGVYSENRTFSDIHIDAYQKFDIESNTPQQAAGHQTCSAAEPRGI